MTAPPTLARKLGVFDATMIVMGGIVGAGIFMNPSVVAREVHTPALILGVWAVGGLIALVGAFVYAELAVLRPQVGGQYAYLRDAFHPMVAFLYGWVLLLVIQTGGMAAGAMTFANYFRELTGSQLSPSLIAVVVLALFTIVNCLGVRSGSNVQSALMVTKIAAVVALIIVGWLAVRAPSVASVYTPSNKSTPVAFAAAMVPVLFAYGGWQTSSFVSGELRNPVRDLPRGLLIGVIGVVLLYLGVNFACLQALGPGGLAATTTPASEVMRSVLGGRGAKLIAAGIAISTVGFSQPVDAHGAAGLLLDGARRGVLSRGGVGGSAEPRAECGNRAAGGVDGGNCAVGEIRADPELCGVDGCGVFWAHRGGADRLAAARAGGAHQAGRGCRGTPGRRWRLSLPFGPWRRARSSNFPRIRGLGC